MSGSEKETDNGNDSFSIYLTDEELNNQRTAVRYIRTDITVTLRILGLFNSSKYLPVKLLDLSSKGLAMTSEKKISLKTKVILSLTFKNGMNFKIPAKIVYKNKTKKQYGVKFNQSNDELGDFILSSQEDLIFK